MNYPVGTTIDNIDFVLLDKNNNEVLDYKEWIVSTTADSVYGYVASWSTTTSSISPVKTSKKSGKAGKSSKNKPKVLENINGTKVPDIRLSEQEEEVSYVYELHLNGTKLIYEFTIKTDPGMLYSTYLFVN